MGLELKVSIGGLIAYLIFSLVFLIAKDRFHTTLFLIGSVLWIACIFVFTRE